jgi:acyl-homoserine lactone acylase PvdQ
MIGQSGQPLSRHYADQWSHYYFAQSYPMQFREVKADAVLRLKPR